MDLKPITGFMREPGITWMTLDLKVRHTLYVKPAPAPPVLLHTACPCGSVFAGFNPRQLWCNRSCRDKARRPHRPRAPRVVTIKIATCGHDTRPVIANGQCRPCYARAWRLNRSTA